MKEKAIHLASSVDDFGTCCIRVDPHAKGMGRVEPEPASDHYSFNSLRPAFGSRSHPPLHIYQFYYMIPGVLRDARQQGSYFLMGSNNRLGHSGVYAHVGACHPRVALLRTVYRDGMVLDSSRRRIRKIYT